MLLPSTSITVPAARGCRQTITESAGLIFRNDVSSIMLDLMYDLVFFSVEVSIVFYLILYLRSLVEVNILRCQQLDRHIVDGTDLVFQNDSPEQCFDTVISLHVSMLCDKE